MKIQFLLGGSRRLIIWILLASFLFLLTKNVYPEEKKFKPKFSLESIKLTYGQGYMAIGDINRALKSFNNNDCFEYWRAHKPERVIGEIKTLDTSISDFELELLMNTNFLGPNISFSLATSFPSFNVKNESSLTFIKRGWAGDQIEKFTFKPEVKVWRPLRVGISYQLLSLSIFNINMKAGIDFYHAELLQTEKYDSTPPTGGTSTWAIFYFKARQFFFGLNGGIELELNLLKNFAFVLEAEGRFGKLRNLRGDMYVEQMYFGKTSEEKGALWYYNVWDHSLGVRYDYIMVYKDRPAGGIDCITDERKAIFDLSGYSFRVGARIKLF